MTLPAPPHHRPETEELLLELLDMPISFHRCFVAISGKVTAALLLSYLWWAPDGADPEEDGWIARPLDTMREDTGLSRDELSSARRTLRELAILEERRRGMPPVVEFRVDRARVAQLLMDELRARQAAHGVRCPQEQRPLSRLAH